MEDVLKEYAVIADAFKQLCNNLKLDNYSDMKSTVGEIAKKLNNVYYGLNQDSVSHMYIVGSVGRKTAVKGNSDLDIIFDLPNEVFKRFDNQKGNGQSCLLQEVRKNLLDRYPKTNISGDGQVVVIEFNKYTVELVPGFKQQDNTFKYPDTHDGGSWKYTDPISEQKECRNSNISSNGIYYDFCRIVRCWKNNCGFKFGGLLIDTLVYDHFKDNNYYSSLSVFNYSEILKNLFEYFGNMDENRTFWYAVGSNQKVYVNGSGRFIKQSRKAFKTLEKAINEGEGIADALEELLGNDFIVKRNKTKFLEQSLVQYKNTEEFIYNKFPVDIRYSLNIECTVSQNGFPDRKLSEILRKKMLLKHHKNLVFCIENTSCPKPYDIYWKVRNVGRKAEERDCIRGQITRTDCREKKEHTDFQGPHFVECYLVKKGVCVAKGHIDVPIDSN